MCHVITGATSAQRRVAALGQRHNARRRRRSLHLAGCSRGARAFIGRYCAFGLGFERRHVFSRSCRPRSPQQTPPRRRTSAARLSFALTQRGVALRRADAGPLPTLAGTNERTNDRSTSDDDVQAHRVALGDRRRGDAAAARRCRRRRTAKDRLVRTLWFLVLRSRHHYASLRSLRVDVNLPCQGWLHHQVRRRSCGIRRVHRRRRRSTTKRRRVSRRWRSSGSRCATCACRCRRPRCA